MAEFGAYAMNWFVSFFASPGYVLAMVSFYEAVREWLFFPISASGANDNPRNTALYSCGYQFRLPLRGAGPMDRRFYPEKNISFWDNLIVENARNIQKLEDDLICAEVNL